MARPRSVYACTECGGQQPRWLGRCPECGAWNTLVEEAVGGAGGSAGVSGLHVSSAEAGKPLRLGEIQADGAPRMETGIPELDRVLGGGLVPGSVVLLAGEPGVGKSTLALQIAASARSDAPILYVTGEESAEQVRMRADRLPGFPADLLVLPETQVEALAAPWREHDPAVVIVDSIQTLRSERVESAPGSVAQVRESAALLAAAAKRHGAALVLVGHVTKEGAIAGPRVLEHMVDVVLGFEGDRQHPFRLLRASKNRFGSTQEVGVFSMGSAGLEGVENPSELFLAERRGGAPGSCIVPLLEGTRPMLVEIQALVAPAGYGTARRTCLGVDDARLALMLAVLDRRTDVDVLSRDVYVNVAGGVRSGEPGADLGLALALASSRLDKPLPTDVAACGEVGLGGEVRRVGRIDLRVREAVRLGFHRVLLPERVVAEARPPAGAELISVGEVADAVRWLRAQA
ncbi:MAG: DNA repair protein RadA [Deltaproteobacteria bacterium]|nr:DNA repair protein RadA [Deltaproteobacteria bacterium]MBW2360782.1 DNA repair protein RadA [Deltaproteobacteria bacterium]